MMNRVSFDQWGRVVQRLTVLWPWRDTSATATIFFLFPRSKFVSFSSNSPEEKENISHPERRDMCTTLSQLFPRVSLCCVCVYSFFFLRPTNTWIKEKKIRRDENIIGACVGTQSLVVCHRVHSSSSSWSSVWCFVWFIQLFEPHNFLVIKPSVVCLSFCQCVSSAK
jgi:hypothetical protein